MSEKKKSDDQIMEEVESKAQAMDEAGGPTRQTPGHKGEPDLRYKANREDIKEFHEKQKEAGQE